MSNLYLYTHNQLGDHFVCYGFVKELSSRYEKIFLYTKPDQNHVKSVKRLYSNIPNVVVSPNIVMFNMRVECNSSWYTLTSKWYKNPLDQDVDESLIFDRHWYNQVNVPFSKKWDNFKFERDIEKEKHIFYEVLKLKDDEPFIFLHEDPSRNFIINREHIKSDIKIIEASKLLDIEVFDLLYTIEKSLEVHVINSVFLTYIDLMGLNHSNLNYHKYTRNTAVEQPGLRLNWKILN
jgi:hypothetical protein